MSASGPVGESLRDTAKLQSYVHLQFNEPREELGGLSSMDFYSVACPQILPELSFRRIRTVLINFPKFICSLRSLCNGLGIM